MHTLPRPRTSPALSILAVAMAVTAPAAAQDTATAPPLEIRLDRLVEKLEEQRQSLHVPGMSIAVIADDRVVLSRGFGQRDVEASLPADEDTVYAIGSVSKSFTSALVAMLGDEGKIGWDEPVWRYVRGFTLSDEAADEQIVIRDLLSHRCGLMSLDLLWYAGGATWEDMLPCVARAEPTAGFRQRFQYNNVMYLAAGQALATAGGADWSTLVQSRILDPLVMDGSAPTLPALEDRAMVANGYKWDDEKNEFEQLPMRPTVNIAPAGSIHSSVRDMAQWVRLQINRGEVDGERLVAAEQFDEMWSSHVDAAPGTAYGLGWMIGEHGGHKLIEHGGGIDGFTSSVAFLPDEGVGYVMLTNANGTSLPVVARSLVFDALLGTGDDDDAEELDYNAVEPLLGKYHFDVLDADLTVMIQDGGLAIDVPGQMIFQLNPPDDDGKRTFKGFEQIALRFAPPEDDGAVNALTMYQAGLEFEIMRVGVEVEPEVDVATLRPYVGRYRLRDEEAIFEVLIQNGRLAVDVPGQMVYELHEPDDEGRRFFRVTPTVAVTFDRGDDGAVASMTMIQAGIDTVFDRVDGGPVEDLPTPDAVMAAVHAARGTIAYLELFNLKLTGTIDFVNIGMQGEITQLASGFDRFWQRVEFEPFGWAQDAFIGREGWHDDAYQPFQTLEGPLLAQAKLEHPAVLLGFWSDSFEKIEVIGREKVGDRDAFVLRVEPPDLPSAKMFIDVENGRLLRSEGAMKQKQGPNIKIVTRFEDYRVVAGVTLPFRIITQDDLKGRVIVQFDEAVTDIELADEPWFMYPPAEDESPDESPDDPDESGK